LIQRSTYDAVGGHASVAGEVLEDVALARRAKQDSWGIWFGSGAGFVSVRMYVRFAKCGQVGARTLSIDGRQFKGRFHEFESAFPWMTLLVLLFGLNSPRHVHRRAAPDFSPLTMASNWRVTNSPLNSSFITCLLFFFTPEFCSPLISATPG